VDTNATNPSLKTEIIRPRRGWTAIDFRELWRYRELLFFFVWRDVKVRYKQTLLGAVWAILQPFLTMVVFTVFFHRMANISSGDLPYPIFSYAGVLPWTLFAAGLSASANSLVGSQALLKKVYFPRLLLPLAAVGAPVVDFCLGFLVYIGMMFWYGIMPSWRLLLVPPLLLLVALTSLSMGFWLAAINVRYRDVRYVIPFFVQIWLFVTPVIYPTDKITSHLVKIGLPPWLYGLNPMVGVIQTFRWALVGESTNVAPLLVMSLVIVGILILTGAFYFRRTEQVFADIV